MKKVSFFVIVVFENCVSLTGRPISNANSFFFGTSLFYLSSIDVNTIENHVHHLHIIIDRNQEFIFFSLKPFRIHKQKISWRDCWSVNIKSKNGKILNVGCNITVTKPLITTKK